MRHHVKILPVSDLRSHIVLNDPLELRDIVHSALEAGIKKFVVVPQSCRYTAVFTFLSYDEHSARTKSEISNT